MYCVWERIRIGIEKDMLKYAGWLIVTYIIGIILIYVGVAFNINDGWYPIIVLTVVASSICIAVWWMGLKMEKMRL